VDVPESGEPSKSFNAWSAHQPNRYERLYSRRIAFSKLEIEVLSRQLIAVESNLERVMQLVQPTPIDFLQGRRDVILLRTGAFNPVALNDLDMIDIVAKFLLQEHRIEAIAGFVSLPCDDYVRKSFKEDTIPFVHCLHTVSHKRW
jgi:hypothetical protein